MLRHSKAFSGFSVDDLQKAEEFYGRVLGLTVRINPMGILEMKLSGGNSVIVYPKPNHEPATYTVLNFPVPDLEKAVEALTARGLRFEQYVGALQTDELGIFRDGDMKIAWFKDPAGNILSILEEKQESALPQ
ncbi:MAG TPA: VOC family protein [Cyclobacteriaceae bacterium]|nr:VOC family protein [Cyclobacteriaceae bacterium]